MDWTSLIGPAVVAAIVSGFVSIVGFMVSARTARSIHSQRLVFDEKQAERKFDFDKELAERRFKYDSELAERKFSQEREQVAYKRRFEFAEALLADAHRFQTLVHEARRSGSFSPEGMTRKSNTEEPEQLKKTRDMYYVPIERLNKDGQFLANFFAKQFTASALFGPEAKISFDILSTTLNKIVTASEMLIALADQSPRDDNQKLKSDLLDDLWASRPKAFGREDGIETQILGAISILETICRPILERTNL